MTDSRSRRARELFDQLLDLPERNRDARLEEVDREDPELAREVRTLLDAHAEAAGFLEGEAVARALGDLSGAEAVDPLIGATVGDYRILALLGRGGMGAVYRAEQEHPRREVALKLLDRGFESPPLRRRFEVEAEVLARLKHPGIAQVHVAGTTGPELGGRPWFAMELVEGRPLTDFADEHRLDLRERLELLVRVCEAVQHAHQVGVIHRDLKPANILVTAEGRPKILDFGIARGTDADLQVTTVADGGAALVGTLPYMSPEQVEGEPDRLDTRSDVYALGVLGYELLTGELPRDLEGRSLTDAIRAIADEEPRSLRAAGKGGFAPDLETIVAKALASEREWRYDSASELAADLQRFLDGQPIGARPPSALYQLRKLVARNRLPAALLAGLVLLAIASAIVMAFQVRRTVDERDRARIEATTANEASTFLEGLFLQADPELALGETLTAREILDRGAERIETELEEQPVVRGRLLTMLGKVYDGLGERERAAPLLAEAVELGRALQAEQAGAADRSNLQLALCLGARCEAAEGRNDEAVAMCREAVALAEKVEGPESVSLATCLNHLAYQLTLSGGLDEARVHLERGLALRERLLGPEDVDTGWSVYQYAHLLEASGETERAQEELARACEIWEAALPANHPQLARAYLDHARLLGDAGRFDEAIERAERGLAMQDETLGRDHRELADTLSALGFLNWQRDNLPESYRYYTEAAKAHEAALGTADPGLLDRLQNVVYVANAMKRPDLVLTASEEALGLAREYHADDPATLGLALGRLGFLLVHQGRDDEGVPLIEEAEGCFERAGEDSAKDLLIMRRSLYSRVSIAETPERALELGEGILSLLLAHPELESTSPLFLRWEIGRLLFGLGRVAEAEARLQELLPDVESAFDVNAFFPWNVRWLIAHCRWSLGDEAGARALYDEVLRVDPASLGDDLYWLKLRLAEDHAAAGRLEEARRELRAALEANLSPTVAREALRLDPRLSEEVRAELER